MTWWEGILLGVVQGLTEFLPVSSSGHLVLGEALLGLQPPGVFFEVTVHVATLVAVLLVYRGRILELFGAFAGDAGARRSILLLAVASAPLVLGAVFQDFFERVFHSVPLVGVNLLVTGAFLWSTRWTPPPARPEPGVPGALGIGFAQVAAIFPGISRSGATVSAGLWLRVDPVRAAEFSFLMSIPAIVGAAVLQVPDLVTQGRPAIATAPLVLSFLAALLSGVVAIRLLVSLLARRAFHRFAPYCWTVGGAVLIWSLIPA